ncbi:hypothetical protein SDRG_13669 [Saprolegnia diclina VS20]|uniref:Uncharacterized protein n=1 Tax=Saprolegnia diclina (strain VS20) TaxID=1156394 RepID=T0R8Z3_SAPDV|nr:hypothetical protein SDRG_13669 [Saprolegnia diclina VS20]EQC28593.1 hypothetical protein SDRG_13669 [Saprolegnia diclina VS20]|eukprot:XP_008617990.1 hypothetical protein SDRG_13669 [Saprolegnia diclina VS20]
MLRRIPARAARYDYSDLAVSCHKLQQRSYIVVPLAKVSPTMTGGRITAWQKDVGAYVDCYDLLYEFDAQGVTDDDALSAVKMEVECCDEGFLAVVFDLLPAGSLHDEPLNYP